MVSKKELLHRIEALESRVIAVERWQANKDVNDAREYLFAAKPVKRVTKSTIWCNTFDALQKGIHRKQESGWHLVKKYQRPDKTWIAVFGR